MKFIKLNEAELSNVIGGKLTDVKDGFVETIVTPVTTVWKMVTFKSNEKEKGKFLGAIGLIDIGFFAPLLYKKVVQLKSLILS